MAERLAALSARHGLERVLVNPRRIDQLAARRREHPDDSFAGKFAFAKELLNAGRSKESLTAFQGLAAASPHPQKAELDSWLGIAALRLGEQQNCVQRHNADSCLMPIRGGGVHLVKQGALAAIEHFSRALALRPGDLASRWLLNIAHMTAGQYPAGVPPRWLIPPEAFKPAAPFPRFPDRAVEAGLAFTGHAGGVVSEDFQGSGLLDLMVSSMGLEDPVRYFRNNGDGTFTERTEEAGLRGITGGLNLAEADYDNDGHPDVLVERGAWHLHGGGEPLSLLRNNGDGTFSDVTRKAGLLEEDHQTQAAAWADLDGDGWLDLLVCDESYGQSRRPCRLFHNNQDGTFADAAKRAGLDAFGMIKSVAAADYDNDGRLDVYIGRWGQDNILFRQNADGTFSDVTAKAGVAGPLDSFPSWFFDYDNDGWLDLLTFGFIAPPDPSGYAELGYESVEDVAADFLGLPFKRGKPRLYRNKGDGTFADVTDGAGLNKALFAMGSNFADLDNDGYPDFYVGTGVPDLRGLMPNRLFRNDGGRGFLDVTAGADVGHLQKGHGVAMGDLNNDGYPDIFAVMGGAYEGDVFQRALFANPGGDHHWVGLTLEGVRSNRSALGARIKVLAQTPSGPRAVYGAVSTGGSFGASGLRQIVGLGQASAILSVEVRWPRPGGPVQRFEGLELDRFWTLKEGESRPRAQAAPNFSWTAAGRAPSAYEALGLPQAEVSGQPVAFRVDPRVELVSIALMLSSPRGQGRASSGYAGQAEARFSALRAHRFVQRLARWRRERGEAVPGLRLLFEAARPGAAPSAEALELLGEARDFALQGGFREFFESQRPLYRDFIARAQAEALAAMSPQAALAYLGLAPGARRDFCLAALLGPADALRLPGALGPGTEVWVRPRRGSEGAMGFGFDALEASVAHELTRAAVDHLPSAAGFEETLARAVILRALALDLGERAYQESLRRYEDGGPPLLGLVGERLKDYEAERGRYPTLESFFPRLEPILRLPPSGRPEAPAGAVQRPQQRLKALGTKAFVEGDDRGALESFSAALKLSENDVEALLDLAVVYERMAQRTKALEHYERAIAQGLRDLEGQRVFVVAALSSRAALLASAQRKEEAARDLRKALELAPQGWDGKAQLEKRLGALAP